MAAEVELNSLKKKVEERELNAGNVFMASFLAGLNELGVLNQGVVNISSSYAGEVLSRYAIVMGFKISPDTSPEEQIREAINFLNENLKIGTLSVEFSENSFLVKISSSKCRFCPKGVGGAELEGTLCPFPKLIEKFLSETCHVNVSLIPEGLENRVLTKQEGFCIIKYSLESK